MIIYIMVKSRRRKRYSRRSRKNKKRVKRGGNDRLRDIDGTDKNDICSLCRKLDTRRELCQIQPCNHYMCKDCYDLIKRLNNLCPFCGVKMTGKNCNIYEADVTPDEDELLLGEERLLGTRLFR
jgi:hypothetical protein